MAADYAGAVAAIQAKFTAEWVIGAVARTPVGFINQTAPVAKNEAGQPAPWVLFEIVHAGSYRHTNAIRVYDGIIKAHVFLPKGTGDADGLALAIAAGEIFRNKVFYDGVTAGCYVRSGHDLPPRVDDGDITSDDGKWFTLTASIPFEAWVQD